MTDRPCTYSVTKSVNSSSNRLRPFTHCPKLTHEKKMDPNEEVSDTAGIERVGQRRARPTGSRNLRKSHSY